MHWEVRAAVYLPESRVENSRDKPKVNRSMCPIVDQTSVAYREKEKSAACVPSHPLVAQCICLSSLAGSGVNKSFARDRFRPHSNTARSTFWLKH